MCFLALCNLEIIKKFSLNLKNRFCFHTKNDEIKKKLDELYKLEDQIDNDMYKLQDEIHKFKNEFFKYRKTYKGLLL
jgi:hypothetical protein